MNEDFPTDDLYTCKEDSDVMFPPESRDISVDEAALHFKPD